MSHSSRFKKFVQAVSLSVMVGIVLSLVYAGITPAFVSAHPGSPLAPYQSNDSRWIQALAPIGQEETDLVVQVVDNLTGKGAAQITILLVAGDDSWPQTTDSLGQARFPGVLKDSKTTVHITISARGYEEYNQVATISKSDPFFEVRLTPRVTPTPGKSSGESEAAGLFVTTMNSQTGVRLSRILVELRLGRAAYRSYTDDLGTALFPNVLKDTITYARVKITAIGYEPYDQLACVNISDPFWDAWLSPIPTPTPMRTPTSTSTPTPPITTSTPITPDSPTPTDTATTTSTPVTPTQPIPTDTATPTGTATSQLLTATPTATATSTGTVAPTPRPTETPTAFSPATPTPITPSPTVATLELSTATPTPPSTIGGKLAIPLKYYEVFKVYVSGFDGQGINGTSPISLEDARQPMFRPDGQSIIVNGTRGEFSGIYVADQMGKVPHLINDRGEAYWPVWSPDGNEIILSDTNLAYILFRHRSTGLVSNSEFVQLEANGIPIAGRNVLWTENNRLVFAGCADWLRQPGECGIWVTDANQLNPERIITGLDYIPMDAKNDRLVLMSAKDGDWDVYQVPLAGGDVTNLTNNQFIQDGLPSIAPDGKSIAYISDASGQWALWTLTLATGETKKWFEIDPQRGSIDLNIWTEERMSWTR